MQHFLPANSPGSSEKDDDLPPQGNLVCLIAALRVRGLIAPRGKKIKVTNNGIKHRLPSGIPMQKFAADRASRQEKDVRLLGGREPEA
jgi:hypothetical protein